MSALTMNFKPDDKLGDKIEHICKYKLDPDLIDSMMLTIEGEPDQPYCGYNSIGGQILLLNATSLIIEYK